MEIFNTIAKPIAECCLAGYNGSIFAYGQTGAGKTFTVQGPVINPGSADETIASSMNRHATGDEVFE
jgi:hypothetical protein